MRSISLLPATAFTCLIVVSSTDQLLIPVPLCAPDGRPEQLSSLALPDLARVPVAEHPARRGSVRDHAHALHGRPALHVSRRCMLGCVMPVWDAGAHVPQYDAWPRLFCFQSCAVVFRNDCWYMHINMFMLHSIIRHKFSQFIPRKSLHA